MNPERMLNIAESAKKAITALRDAGDFRVLARDVGEGINPKSFPGEMKTMLFGLAMLNAASRQRVDMPTSWSQELRNVDFTLTPDDVHFWKYVAVLAWAGNIGVDVDNMNSWHGKRAMKLRERIAAREDAYPEMVNALSKFHEAQTGRVLI